MSYLYDYADAGFRVITLHEIRSDGSCGCESETCPLAGKHPTARGWQHTPSWSDEQLETIDLYRSRTGFGVIVDDHLVIDVDPRNDGLSGLELLSQELSIDFLKDAGFVVKTGGGGWHIYYKKPSDLSFELSSKLDRYKGVDFKSSGYIVAAGSLHKSGGAYEVESGSVDKCKDAPPALLDLLKKEVRARSTCDGFSVDADDVAQMLKHIDISCFSEYEDWIKIGMAIYSATSGSGFELWDDWSAGGDSYDASIMRKKWDSFDGTIYTVGTLVHHASAGGWKAPERDIVFDLDDGEAKALADFLAQYEEPEPSSHLDDIDIEKLELSGIDLTRPPAGSLVADCADYLRKCGRSKREHLAVAAALQAVGNAGGLTHKDRSFGASANLITFGVAGSASGKEAILQGQADLHRAAGLSRCTLGKPKSAQEIGRALLDSQAALYVIDEFGLELQRVESAKVKGGTSYLEAIPATIMEAYTKHGGVMPLGLDDKEKMREKYKKAAAAAKKAISEYEDVELNQQRYENALRQLAEVETGIINPFLSIAGYTTPETFTDLVTRDNATSGFFGRAMIFVEHDHNPKQAFDFKSPELSRSLSAKLKDLSSMCELGECVRAPDDSKKIEVITPQPVVDMLREVHGWLYDYSCKMDTGDGYQPLIRRAFEQVLKVTFILAIGRESKIRTVEDVRWAFALVRKDVDTKISLTRASIAKEESNKIEALKDRIYVKLNTEIPRSAAQVRNAKMRGYDIADIVAILEELVSCGRAVVAEPSGKVKKYLAIEGR